MNTNVLSSNVKLNYVSKKLNLTNNELSELLDLERNKIIDWKDGKGSPDELDRYKINWLFYLVYDLGEDFTSLLYDYNFDGLTLSSTPDGNDYHDEPWLSKYSNVKATPHTNRSCSNDIKDNNSDTATDDVSLPETIEEVIGTDFDENDPLLRSHIETLMDNEFNFKEMSLQETIRCVNRLIKACDIYSNALLECINTDNQGIDNIYNNVNDYDSFRDFINVIKNNDLNEERDFANMSVHLHLDLNHTSRITNITDTFTRLSFSFESDDDIVIKRSDAFKIVPAHKSELFDFIMFHNGNLFYLDFVLQ